MWACEVREAAYVTSMALSCLDSPSRISCGNVALAQASAISAGQCKKALQQVDFGEVLKETKGKASFGKLSFPILSQNAGRPNLYSRINQAAVPAKLLALWNVGNPSSRTCKTIGSMACGIESRLHY